jgi:hypothetical protein
MSIGQTSIHKQSYLRWAHEMLFAIYFSVVAISAEETRGSSWATTLRLIEFSHRFPGAAKPIDDPHRERFIMFLLVWLLAAMVFISLRLLAQFSFTEVFVNLFAGFVALAGLPLALLYCKFGNPLFLWTLVVVAGIYVFLYTSGKLSLPGPFSALILTLYFGFSTWIAWISSNTFPLGFYLLLPSWDSILGTWEWTKAVYPLLGLSSAMVWALYVRHMQVSHQLVSALITE